MTAIAVILTALGVFVTGWGLSYDHYKKRYQSQWFYFISKKPEIGDQIIVKDAKGQKYYAIYSDNDELDMNKPKTGKIFFTPHREAWYKHTTLFFPQWKPIDEI